MNQGSLLPFLLLQAAVIVLGYLLAAWLLKARADFFSRPLLTGLLATILAHGFLGVSEGFDALVTVSLLSGFVYGFAGGIVIEWLRRRLRGWKPG